MKQLNNQFKITTSPTNLGIGVFGLSDGLLPIYISDIQSNNKNIVVVLNNVYRAQKVYEDLLSYNDNVLFFPMDDFITSEAIAISSDFKNIRLNTMRESFNKKGNIVVTHLDGYLRFLTSKGKWQNQIIDIKLKEETDVDYLSKNLSNIGYKKVSVVENQGEYAARGYIIDVFPLDTINPVRIEIDFDEVFSIREFDITTQLKTEEISKIKIFPCAEITLDEEKKQKLININEDDFNNEKYYKHIEKIDKDIDNISSYFEDVATIFVDYETIETNYFKLKEEMFEFDNKNKYMFDLLDIKETHNYFLHTLNNISTTDKFDRRESYLSSEPEIYSGNLEEIKKDLKKFIRKEYTVLIALSTDEQISKLQEHINFVHIGDKDSLFENKVNVIKKDISTGFIFNSNRLVVFTPKELFGEIKPKIKYRKINNTHQKIKSYEELENGDYVIHNVHGIGIYNGLHTISKKGLKKDFIQVVYKNNDKLYIPVEKINMISKYSSKDGAKPKINKLGSDEWEKTKARVRGKVKEMAFDLLKLYAKRETKIGHSFGEDTEEQIQFEKSFPYDDTEDQIKVTEEIKIDMEKRMPMDRLLCGDVGYGKTEIAFRASFKSIMDSKQVAYLCPTTILSSQHYKTALKRFEDYPISIALLNRFTTPKKVREILIGVKKGTIDFLIGTHRLLSKDVEFKDLGLLIIDEEQRFGVEHKEKVKNMAENIDVLSLTATPIPRTLQMSIIGMRNLSLIKTPPANRYPIQTYVVDENESIIKDAIEKELARDGQVFILSNRVAGIETKASKIQSLVKDAKVTFAHGKMGKTQLEDKMQSFINKEYNVLVCTTIIETGIDIPNANTLIILDADKLGLAQLYQIRGRIGRSDRIGYAYLMYKKDKTLSEIAAKRLNVIKEFTQLGSGFQVASRDLSIRGAGDLLGSEQAGFIDTVGIELYLKMVKEEIDKIKGIEVEENKEVRRQLPIVDVETFIDDKYIDDENLKLEIHKKINKIDTLEKLESIKKELIDRFGKMPDNMIYYMYEEWLDKIVEPLLIKTIKDNRRFVELLLPEIIIKKVKPEFIFKKANKINNKFRFNYRNKLLSITLDKQNNNMDWLIDVTKLINDIYQKNKKLS